MATNEIRVFYSWQSDLPGNLTRSLIQEAVDTAVKALRDTVEVVSDRDTKGVAGTPDITETIFKKIAESDLFIADITTLIRKILAYPEFLFCEAETSEDTVLPIQPRDLLSQSLMRKLAESKQVVVSQDERLETVKAVKELFDIDLPESFFTFGSLKKKVTLYPSNTEYIGSEDEKKKYAD